MDKKTEATMAANLLKNTGKSIEYWIAFVKENNKGRHSATVKWLSSTYNMGIFFADLIVHKANGTDAGSFNYEELIAAQYKGREDLKAIYDHLLADIMTLGNDIEIAPKKAYVSLRRKKQFACLKPATKTRFELELIIKGQEATELLECITTAGAMCTHKIKLSGPGEITTEVIAWVNVAYQNAI